MPSDLIKLGGLWTNKDKNGKTYLTGKLSPSVRILIFKNEFRDAENQPTHVMYLSQIEQQQPGEEKKPEESDDFFGEDIPAEPTAAPRPMAPRTAAPPPRTAASTAPAPRPTASRPAPARRPAAEPVEDDLEDPFAE